jgi:hypothetical protein
VNLHAIYAKTGKANCGSKISIEQQTLGAASWKAHHEFKHNWKSRIDRNAARPQLKLRFRTAEGGVVDPRNPYGTGNAAGGARKTILHHYLRWEK